MHGQHARWWMPARLASWQSSKLSKPEMGQGNFVEWISQPASKQAQEHFDGLFKN